MKVDLKRFFSGEDIVLPIDYALDLSGFELNGIYPFQKPVNIIGKLESRTNLVTLEADVCVSVHCPCDRCAEDVDINYNAAIFHRIVCELNQEDNDELLLAENMLLDVDDQVTDAVLLNYPSKLLCSDSCKGICQICGRNLNREQCGCNKKQIDPRLAALEKLIN